MKREREDERERGRERIMIVRRRGIEREINEEER
mgnify:CR=1 FL=1